MLEAKKKIVALLKPQFLQHGIESKFSAKTTRGLKTMVITLMMNDADFSAKRKELRKIVAESDVFEFFDRCMITNHDESKPDISLIIKEAEKAAYAVDFSESESECTNMICVRVLDEKGASRSALKKAGFTPKAKGLEKQVQNLEAASIYASILRKYKMIAFVMQH